MMKEKYTPKSSKLLVVEGNDDEGFFKKVNEEIGIKDLQILGLGGAGEFNATRLKAITQVHDFRTIVRSMAIVRDADEDAGRVFDSICSALRTVDLPFPKKPLEFEARDQGSIKVGVLIIPPKKDKGKLEDLCLFSVQHLREMTCIDSFFECIRTVTDEFPEDLPKAKIKAFLASRKKSVPHLGVGMQKGYFSVDNEVFDGIKTFLKAM